MTHMSRRHPAVLAVMLSSILGVLVASAWPVAAAPPAHQQQIIVHLDCTAQGDFGAAALGLEHTSTGRGWPGGDVRVWPPSADPATDPPVLTGYNRDIARDGKTLTGEVPLRATGDDIVGWSSYTVTFAHAGPPQVVVAKGPLAEYGMRYNQRFRNVKERTPITASGTLTLPGIGSVSLTACSGEEVVENIAITQPATVVGAARYPFSFPDGELCEAKSGGPTTALLSVTGGEAAVVILRHGEEDALAFGAVYPEIKHTTMTGSVSMFSPDGEELGEATLQVTLRVLDRESSHYRNGSTVGIEHVEQVVAEGVIVFDRVAYTLAGCQGVRLRETTISH